jgi:hypothetical protein
MESKSARWRLEKRKPIEKEKIMKNILYNSKFLYICLFYILLFDVNAQTNKIELDEQLWGDAREGFALSMILDQKEVKAGLPVILTVIIKNVSRESLPLLETQTELDFDFIVLDESGKNVNELKYQKELLKIPIFRLIKITYLPEQMKEYKFFLNRRFDMSVIGKYKIQARRKVYKIKGEGVDFALSREEILTIK